MILEVSDMELLSESISALDLSTLAPSMVRVGHTQGYSPFHTRQTIRKKIRSESIMKIFITPHFLMRVSE